METKVCSKCSEEKPLIEFSKYSYNSCKSCERDRHKVWRGSLTVEQRAARNTRQRENRKTRLQSDPAFKEHFYASRNEWRNKNMERVQKCARQRRPRQRDKELRRLYGITLEAYKQLQEQQNAVCAICKQKCNTGRRLSVDHDHVTGIVRGLLCGNCNKGLGNFKDKSELLEAAINYLRKKYG